LCTKRAQEVSRVRPSISAVAAIFIAAPTVAAGQAAPANQGETTSPAAITVVGCVATSPDGKGFLLTRQTGAPGTTMSAGAAPGTSATGDAPSGTVTADTPTGATATETAVPTPPVGEPGTQVNPASPTFAEGGTGTSGTVGRADTAGAASVSVSYRLKPTHGVDLAPHVGHTVEVRGTLGRDSRAAGIPDGPAPSSVNSPVLTVQEVKHRAASCTR
jgi:hypothetical protein